MPRVLIIGLDGGTFDLIKPWVDAGHLPVMAKLLREGAHGYLRSTTPPMTFPAWNAFMTGKNPGKHGVFDFTEREKNSYKIKFTNALYRKTETIWKMLSEQGKTVALIGVPLTYPPENVNGIVISGFDAPGFSKNSVSPSEFYNELRQNVGEYFISPDIAKYIDSGQIDMAVETILSTLEQNTKIAQYILKLRPWDCFMVVFKESDVVCHHFWHYHDQNSPHRTMRKPTIYNNPVLTIYEALDKAIGKLVDIAGKDTVKIIASDHGFGGTGDKIIYLNKWLNAKGLLKFKNPAKMSNPIHKTLSSLKALGTRMIPVQLRKKLLYSKRVGIVQRIESTLRFSHIDWTKTYAYSEETPYYPTIWINLEGRDPEGIVKLGDYDLLRDRVMKELMIWREEDGNHLVKKVFKREELYHGDYVDKAPDLIIEWNLNKQGYSYLSRPSYTSNGRNPIVKLSLAEDAESKFLLGRSGNHRELGVFIAQGTMIKPETLIANLSMIDIAPTILYLMGIPIPSDTDGTVLDSIFDVVYKEKHPIKYSDSATPTSLETVPEKEDYSEDEEEKIKERLKGLGYIE